MFQFDNMEQHVYYNKCACNEMDSLVRRHGLENVPGFVVGNIHYQQLRENFKKFSTFLSANELQKCSYAVVMEHTRNNIKKRYKQAWHNIVHKRVQLNTSHAVLSTFVKFEKIPIGKIEDNKPSRLIQFRSYEYLYELKSYILAHSLLLKKTDNKAFFDQPINTIFTKLYDMDGIARVLNDSWNSFSQPIALCLDHSKFDGHYNDELLRLEHEYWNGLYTSRYLKWLLGSQLINKGRTQNGLRYKMIGHRASGEYTTSEGNGLTNYLMIVTFLMHHGIVNARVHVNGDDSVIIMEKENSFLQDRLSFFSNFNMQTEVERVAYDFRQISYCQSSPIRRFNEKKELVWTMCKAPFRTMSRMCYCDTKYANAIHRYITGIALCEMAVSRGIPVMQDFCKLLLSKGELKRPIGAVDKFPAKLSGTVDIRVEAIHAVTREDFSVAFGVTPQEQLDMESSLAGQLVIDTQSITSFLEKYKNFHLN